MANAASRAERLRTLREMHGWTQADLASATGLSQPLLSSIEKLRRDATPDSLRAIATATDTPLSFFEVEPSTVPTDSLHFRKNKTAPIKLTTQVKAFFREAHRVTTTLLDQISRPIAQFPSADARAGEVDADEIEKLAVETRRTLGLESDAPIPNLTRALERAGAAVFRMTLPGVEEGRVVGKGHYGVSYWGGPGERPVIGYFPGSGDRDRFTIAHELGHIVLHTYRTPCDEAETEAHRFAGALLLPRARATDLISATTTLSEYARIKAGFGISIQAIIMRAWHLGLIDDDRKTSLMVQVGARGWRTSEPVEVVHEEPQLVTKALVAVWPDSPYRRAAEPLAIQPQILRSLAPVLPAPGARVRAADGGNVVSLASRR
ncbi:helix-turn-helix domain-containing protein [Cellulomonas iranensis]|uniref:helix-turn-helix domain-containing protein n=1 Tax=Cellulomonas iranensis TaxID=76862 RepID=UPI000B3D2C1A|nr:XRE family transcriptional regulator [Cellulomonas iranensis]